ncbi:hypothetical protein E2C01_071607 [Portunus trituberculatus]|uniref:Uncharacterized protein n=1 Tax=Portunus trituberculatus TaxID=210409 RepID=A0A5B7HXF5_PORTR|nr:hypothetical protein [Portunus trituberculatus]
MECSDVVSTCWCFKSVVVWLRSLVGVEVDKPQLTPILLRRLPPKPPPLPPPPPRPLTDTTTSVAASTCCTSFISSPPPASFPVTPPRPGHHRQRLLPAVVDITMAFKYVCDSTDGLINPFSSGTHYYLEYWVR